MQYKSSKVVYEGKRINVLSVEVEHAGHLIKREVVDHPGAVVILPFLDPKTILLIRNERVAVQETLWELPAGTLEKKEEPQACAFRELEEETGYLAGKMSPLLQFFSTPGFCNERLFVFVAEDLSFKGQNLDATENIEVHPVLLSKALDMIQQGIIQDAKTIAALLFITSL